MKKVFTVLMIAMIAWSPLFAQKTDSVIIKVGDKSKVIFAIGDKADLQTLKQYNFQAVVDDLVSKLEAKDSTALEKPADSYLKTEDSTQTQEQTSTGRQSDYDNGDRDWDRDRDRNRDDWDRSWEDRNDNDRNNSRTSRKYYGRRTYHSFNLDLGTNNFMTPDFDFPNQTTEAYAVRPWGSWFVAINSIDRTRLSRKFFIEWGAGISWYNFKFENDKVRMSRDASTGTVVFSEDQRDLDFRKSKLTTTYLNFSFVPVLDFGGRSRKSMIFIGQSGSFRVGLGPYAGYRIDSYTKLVYKDGDDNRREKDHDSYYLNNIRYGLRLQLGFGATDLFVNYDMNDLFVDTKGPKLNAFSFGITL